MNIQTAVLSIFIWYFTVGLLLWLSSWYIRWIDNEKPLTYDEVFLLIFVWPILVYFVSQLGFLEMKRVFNKDRKIFFTLWIIQMSVLIILFSVLNLV